MIAAVCPRLFYRLMFCVWGHVDGVLVTSGVAVTLLNKSDMALSALSSGTAT